MKVAIDVSPTQSGHSVRGIGAYTRNLIEEFKNKDFGIDFIFFQNLSSVPPVDFIHYPYFDIFSHTLPIRKFCPRIITIHDVIPLVFPDKFPSGIKGKVNLFLQKRALKNVDAVICDSETSKKDIISKLSISPEKIHVVYLAPGQNFRQIRGKSKLSGISKKYNLPKDFILYVGDVNWNKNLPNLLRAVREAKVNLVMIGKALVDYNLPETQEIEKLAIKDKIIRTGYVTESDLISIYNLAKATILPSFYEGFGLPVLESMACGTPVICSKVASLSEITGNCAIYCSPNDFQNIAAKITEVLNFTKEKVEDISQRSQKHASKFTWEKTAKETIEVYKSTVK